MAARSLLAALCAALLLASASAASPLRHSRQFRTPNTPTNTPLSLTKHIRAGQPDMARALSRVQLPASALVNMPAAANISSYAGYITIDESYNSNTFFWLFESLDGNQDAPLFMWLNGGPGASSMYGLFAELGPFSVADDGASLVYRNTTWCQHAHCVFIDNPVGVGFSYTEDERGYVNNTEHAVAENLYEFLEQFFTVFIDLQDNEFYVTGESYAGKYVPSLTYKIHTANQGSPKVKINLAGMSVGDGMMHPEVQATGYGELLYQEGMASWTEREYWRKQESLIALYSKQGKYREAFEVFDPLLNADFWPYSSYFTNTTGLTNYFNLNQPNYPNNPYDQFLALNSTRQALHVGDRPFHDYNATVEVHLIDDWFKSIAHLLPTILNNYKVLIYNGQLDIILSAPQCDNFLQQLEWNGAKQWRTAQRKILRSSVANGDDGIDGYVQSFGNFHRVIIRGAGHLLPQDQPQRALDMFTAFINNDFPQ